MDFMTAVKTCFSKYATISGRAQRSEFWWFLLFYWGVGMILGLLDSVLFGTISTAPGSFQASTTTPILSGIFMLAMIIPTFTVSVRRLHDTDRSGWWIFIMLIPLIGAILYIVWQASKGTHGENRFGHDPLGGGSDGGDYARSSVPPVR